VVNGGLTVAIALGVPLGTWVASAASWRMTFAGVALLAFIAMLGLIYGLARDVGSHLPVATLAERIRVAARPEVLMALLVTTLWATGAYTVYTYLAIYLQSATMLRGAAIGIVLFVWGVSAGAGVLLGGWGADHFSARRVVGPCLSLGALSFVLLSAIAHVVPPAYALVPVILTTVLWGVSHWAFYPAQQSRLITLGGLRVAPVALSLNASFMYLGFSLGAASGSLALGTVGVANIGLVGAAFVVLSLLLLRATSRGESLLPSES
jgi:predicted MFS family arabinose efflux permease